MAARAHDALSREQNPTTRLLLELTGGRMRFEGLVYRSNETTPVTTDDGGSFSLTSFWFQLLGRGTG